MEDELKEDRGLKEIPASEILAKIEKGEPVEYDHVKIVGDLDISKLDLPKRHIDRTDLEINSFGLEDEIAIINSIIKITCSDVLGVCNFGEAAFEKEVDFSGSHFHEYVDFCGSQFIRTDGDFSGSMFIEDANFSASQFNGWADFKGSRFIKRADFQLSVILGGVDFSESEFNGAVDFLKCQFRFDVDFSGSKFKGTVTFNGSEFCRDACFSRCEFSQKTDFSWSQFDGDSLSFKHSKFCDPISQERACRKAKNVLERNGDRQEAGYYFYCEMDAKRKQKPCYIRYPEFFFLQLIFGYGVHPPRLIAWWGIIVAAFAAFYWIGRGSNGATQLFDYLKFSLATAIAPGYIATIITPGSTGYLFDPKYQAVAIVESIFGTFLWAGFIATFAKKYMR